MIRFHLPHDHSADMVGGDRDLATVVVPERLPFVTLDTVRDPGTSNSVRGRERRAEADRAVCELTMDAGGEGDNAAAVHAGVKHGCDVNSVQLVDL